MIIFDLETSNVDAQTGSILSIGAIDFDNPEDTFYGECGMRVGAEYNHESLEITGFAHSLITNDSKQTTTDLIKKFLNWLCQHDDQTLAGQNPHWDAEFFRAELKRSKMRDIHIGYRMIDLHTVAFIKMMELGLQIPNRNNRTDIDLDAILDFCNLNLRLGAHNALEDSKLEAECFSRIILGKNLIKEYELKEIPEYLRKIKRLKD